MPPFPLPVLTVGAVDPVVRDAAALALCWDSPGGAALTYDLRPDGLQRRLTVGGRLHSDVLLDLLHGCTGCTLRRDLEALLGRRESVGDPLADVLAHGAEALVLALPRAADPAPALTALEGTRTTVVTAVDADRFAHDLLGDDLLAERGLARDEGDRRAVGEVLARLLAGADRVLVSRSGVPSLAALTTHLGPARLIGFENLRAADLIDAARPLTPADVPGDDALWRVAPTGAADADGVWTLDLFAPGPFHPRRLHEAVEALGTGPIRGRGRFWLPTRPDLACGWDGAGGQLSVGPLGPWTGPRSTRLVVTGLGGDPESLREAFAYALASPSESDVASWSGVDDGFDPWLGTRDVVRDPARDPAPPR